MPMMSGSLGANSRRPSLSTLCGGSATLSLTAADRDLARLSWQAAALLAARAWTQTEHCRLHHARIASDQWQERAGRPGGGARPPSAAQLPSGQDRDWPGADG